MPTALFSSFVKISLFLICTSFLGCDSGAKAPITAQNAFPLRCGNIPFQAQLAMNNEEMSTGLMHRVKLGENDGMLFIYEDAGRRSFWMKNTHIPLDLGFFSADGKLQQIVPLQPYNLTPIPSERDDIRYALEMNQGWFQKNGLQVGSFLDIPSLQKAIQMRKNSP